MQLLLKCKAAGHKIPRLACLSGKTNGILWLLLCLTLALLSACNHVPHTPDEIQANTTHLPTPDQRQRGLPHSALPVIAWQQDTLADWRDLSHQGKLTLSQETYDLYAMTAAHSYLPIGTWIKVSNKRNGKKVTVRIHDHLKNAKNAKKQLSLSWLAAQKLGLKKPNQAVHIQTRTDLKPYIRAELNTITLAYLQLGTFNVLGNAQYLAQYIQQHSQQTVKVYRHQSQYRVYLGPVSQEVAHDLLKTLPQLGVKDAILRENLLPMLSPLPR